MMSKEWLDRLKFKEYIRRGHGVRTKWVSIETGQEYTMFIKDMCDNLNHIFKGIMCGKFKECKRGTSYGVKRIEV